jgi:hypothetical protein
LQRFNGQAVYSATDLVGFVSCEHLTNLERAAMAGLVPRPMLPDPELDRITKRGEQHEQRFLAELEEQSFDVVKIATDGSAGTRHEQLVQAAAETLEAMQREVDVIYQATFFDGQWRGHAEAGTLCFRSTPNFGRFRIELGEHLLRRQAVCAERVAGSRAAIRRITGHPREPEGYVRDVGRPSRCSPFT